MGLGWADVARTPQAANPQPLGMRAFDASPLGIGERESGRLLALARGAQGLLMRLRTQRQGTPSLLGTAGAPGTATATGSRKGTIDDRPRHSPTPAPARRPFGSGPPPSTADSPG